MEISYAKDFKHNYLVIKDDRVLENDYQFNMLVKNDIPGLLKCQQRMINGQGLLYYEVTSRQNLKNLYDHKAMGFEDIKNVLESIRKTCENLSHYLLYGSELILEPEYIYLDIDTLECFFLYYPFYTGEGERNLASLLEYFLERHNSEDIKAVEAIYQLTDIEERQHLKIQEALEWFSREYVEEEIQTLSETKSITENCLSEERDYSPEYSGETGVKSMPGKRKGLLARIKKWFITKEEDDEFVFESPEYDFQSIGQSMEESVKDNETTVFIPWIENSEQKLYGVGRGNKYHIDLKKAPLIIGKQSENVDMMISDPTISRMHAKIVKSGSKYSLTDLNSTNGTFRNGLRLLPNETVNIEPGDEIGFGKLKFIYR